MYKKIFIGTLMFLTFFFLVGCQSSKDSGDFLPASQKDVSRIKLWGKEKGIWQDGRLLNMKETSTIIKWVNNVKRLDIIKLPSEMKPPQVNITIYFQDNKTIQIFPWGDDLIMNYSDSNSFKIEQQDLKRYIVEKLK